MLHLFFRLSKIVLLLALPIFLVSGVAFKNLNSEPFQNNDYSLEVFSNLDNDLRGCITFETHTEQTVRGTFISTLRLTFMSSEKSVDHSMQILVAKENGFSGLSDGKYKVSEELDSFLNSFEGVFGYVNMNSQGEAPYFTQNGQVEIENITENTLEGSLNLSLKNTEGKLIQMKGNFVAINE